MRYPLINSFHIMLSFFTQFSDLGLILFKLAFAAIFAVHGWAKIQKPEGLAAGMGWPIAVARLVGVLELVGGLAILFGFFVQWAALILALIMIGAMYTKITKWKVPFWAQQGTGWEFDLILLGVAIFFLTNPI